MSNCLKAIFFSLVAHCFVAFGLAFWIGHASTVELPLLDLSAVEISFSEEERESPAVPSQVSDTPPPPPVSDTPPPPPVSDTPPTNEETTKRLNEQTEQPEPDPPPPSPEPDPPPPPEPDAPPPPPLVSDTPPTNEETTKRLNEQAKQPEPDTPPPPPVSDTPPTNEETTKRLNEQTEQARVDAPPKPLKNIKPDYPKGARQRGEEGDVALELAINARGGVESVTVVASSGFPELDAAAVRAAGKAHFTPARSGRIAIPSTARLTITFKLTGR